MASENGRLSRSQQGEQTKTRLTHSALELFAQRGYNNVSISDICSSVGVTVGVFYHYFRTKSDVIRVISQEGNEKIKAYTFKSSDTIPRLAELFHYFAEITAGIGRDTMKVIMTPANDLIYTNNQAAKLAMVLLERGRSAGEISSAQSSEDQLKMLFAIVWGIICLWCQDRSSFDLVTDIDSSVALALKALEPPTS